MKINKSYPICICILFFTFFKAINAIHGGIILALAGKDSINLSVDSRFSSVQTGSLLLGHQQRSVFRVGPKTIVACLGLEADAIELINILRSKLINVIDEDIDPENVGRLISSILYDSNLICYPVVAGLGSKGPYICSMDGLGAMTKTNDFVASGSSVSALLTACEAEYVSNCKPNTLLSIAQKIIKSALQRDVVSGCKIHSYTLFNNKIFVKEMYLPDV